MGEVRLNDFDVTLKCVNILNLRSGNFRLMYEPVCEKTNNLGSDQVQHKPGCTVTEDG